MHQPIKFLIRSVACLIVYTSAWAVETHLSWNAPATYVDGSPADVVAGYTLYFGSESETYSGSVSLGNQTSFLLSGLPDVPTLYFAVTALATNGTESAYSGELAWERKAMAPVLGSDPGPTSDSVWLTMSTDTAEAAIHYTLDGSDPTPASPVYTAPVLLTSSAFARAIAVKDNLLDSDVSEQTFTVVPDIVPPTILEVSATADNQQVMIQFSERVQPADAETLGNYLLLPGVSILNAQLSSPNSVTLSTSPLAPSTAYLLVVNGIRDLSSAGNEIASGTAIEFTFEPFTRVTDGLLALYSFDEGTGSVVYDVSGNASPLHLNIDDPSNVTWLNGGLCIDNSTKVFTPVHAEKISQACKATQEFTLEMWIRPSNVNQDGPARIVTMSSDSSSTANFMVGAGRWGAQPKDVVEFRVHTSSGALNTTTPQGSLSPALQHVVVTRDASGLSRTYVDGNLAVEETVAGSFNAWNDGLALVLANEMTEDRPWLGEYHLLAVYDQALSSDEVTQNLESGCDGFTSGCFLDEDHDGQPDVWEAAQFGDLTVSGQEDLDLDGRSNLEEFISGTDPNTADMGPSVHVAFTDGAPTIRFEARAASGVGYEGFERYFTVETSDTMNAQDWTPVSGLQMIAGAGQTEAYVPPSLPQGFWRIRVWLQ